MDFTLLAFLAFAVVTVVAAGAVISVRSPVHAALCLVLTFFTVACTWILADAEFLGIALVVVYVGAVMVLFMFVVMMLDIDEVKMHEGYVRYLPVGLLVAVVMLVEMVMLIGIKSRATPFGADPALAAGKPNIEWLAERLFTGYLLPFEVAALILTVAVIAAVTLTLRKREGTKHQVPSAQARVRAGDRFRMVRMDAAKPAPDAPASAGEADGETR
ncbi:NADH-quinone oxidoreductase subunit J [Luteimonas mephitis]|uniref:NADH-quinone oxidoreductase subunit J n=1 Tax=Luteimonas mephitis TaxID=83615 RepID=UPI003A947765